MSAESIIHEAGKNLVTVTFDYTEKDGSNEGVREVEPYSYRRNSDGQKLFYGFDLGKNGTRSFRTRYIHNIKLTSNSFRPRWPVEV